MPFDDADLQAHGPVRTTDPGAVVLSHLREVLTETSQLLDAEGIAYGIMGGLAVATLGRPRWTHDIDVFLRPRDAARAFTVLADAGYDTERTDHEWLFKAWRERVVVDLIFRSTNNIYFDDETEARCIDAEFLGVPLRIISPEDLLVIKAAADTELNHYHWFDALAVMARHRLDWEYVLWRARSSQRRLLSLLIYADASDVDVPGWVIRQLATRVYGDGFGAAEAGGRARIGPMGSAPSSEIPAVVPNRLEEAIRQRLRSDPRIGDLDIGVVIDGDMLVITGDVDTDQRRREIAEVAVALLPEWQLKNRVEVRKFHRGAHVETVS